MLHSVSAAACVLYQKHAIPQFETYRDEAALGAGDVGVIEGEVHSAIRVSEQIQATHLAARVTLEVVIALLWRHSHAFWNKRHTCWRQWEHAESTTCSTWRLVQKNSLPHHSRAPWKHFFRLKVADCIFHPPPVSIYLHTGRNLSKNSSFNIFFCKTILQWDFEVQSRSRQQMGWECSSPYTLQVWLLLSEHGVAIIAWSMMRVQWCPVSTHPVQFIIKSILS